MHDYSPFKYYTEQLGFYQNKLADATKRIKAISRLRLLVMLIALGFIVAGINYNESWQWWLSGATTAAFLILVRIHGRLHDQEKLLKIYVFNVENELKSLDGDHTSFAAGAEFMTARHPFSFDLDIFGKGSVFQLLNRTVTLNGHRQFAHQLQDPVIAKDTIIAKQDIIDELSANPQFLSDFRAAGMSVEEEEKDYERVRHWLKADDDFISSNVAKLAIYVMPLVSIVFIVLSIMKGTLHPGLAIAVAVNYIVLGMFRKQTGNANLHIGKTARLVEKYQQLQLQTSQHDFKNDWLKMVAISSKTALLQIIQFRKLANTFDSRNNSMVGPLMNSFFLFDIYCLLRLEWWRKKHSQLLLQAMEEMIGLDVYVSCAIYAFNHPENTYPVIDATSSAIKAKNLRHPLLLKTAVGNHFSLGDKEQFYLLTGANMTGKSTFIRTVGTNLLMGYIGLPLPAEASSLPLLKIYTSIRVTDSIQDDVSYFRAELNRIKDIMNAVEQTDQSYLILLDEPLRGTNSGDKQRGTKSIIETLLKYQAVGIVATHDIGLTSLATEHPGKVSNYHFESTIGEAGLVFDFKLHPGGSTSNNATILMKQMGIIG